MPFSEASSPTSALTILVVGRVCGCLPQSSKSVSHEQVSTCLFRSAKYLLGAGIMLAAKNGNLGPIYGGRVLAGIGVGGELLKILLYGTD